MKFNEKYTNKHEGTKDKRMLITNDAMAIGEIIQELINKIEKVRVSII